MEMMCLYFLFAVSVLALHTADGNEEVVENAAERSRLFKPRVSRYQQARLPQVFSTNIVSAKTRSPNAGAAQIRFFDALAKGEEQWPIKNCPARFIKLSSSCKVQYTLTRGECSLYEVVNNLFNPLKQDNVKFDLLSTGKYSRGLVKLADYKFASASSFKFDTCQGKKTLKFKLNSAEVKPNDWLTLKSIELQVELNYGVLHKAITEDWFVTKITGKATMTVGEEEIEVDISQNAEEGSSNDKKYNSQDVVLIPKTTSVKVQNFMSALRQDSSQLYPERSQQDLDYVALYRLNELTVKQKDSTQVFNIILTGTNTWDAYITGTPSTSFFDHATDFYVYCKNGEPDDYDTVMCAIMCKFDKDKFKWSSTTSIISGVANDLREETTGILLDVLQANKLYFHSSRRGFEIPNSIQVIKTFEEFVYLKGNTKSSVDPNEPEVETFNSRFVDSGMCLAARIEGLKERIPEFNLDALFVHVCPSFSKIILRVPFNYPKDVTDPSVFSYKFLPFLLLGATEDEQTFGIYKDQKVYLIEQELKRKPNGNLQFCHQYSFYPKYNFIDSSDTFQLNNMKFIECKAKAERQWELVGSGNEVIVDAISEVQAKRIASNEYGVEGNLNIFDAGAIAERTASYLPDTHKTVFKNLNNFTITTCKFEGSFSTPLQIIFSGTALIRNNFVFEMKFVRQEPQQKSLALCLVGENDSMGDMIGYLYMNPLMRQVSWKRFKKIGLISRASKLETNWQNVDCQNMDRSSPIIGIKVYAENIDLTNCDEGGQTNLVCRFLQRCYGSTLNIVYTGILKTNNRYNMTGRSNQLMHLGPGLTFKGNRFRTEVEVAIANTPEMSGQKQRRVKKRNEKSTTDKPTLISKDYVMGDLMVESIGLTLRNTIISFNGDEVMLQIQRSASRNVLDVLGIPNVKTHYGVHTDPYALSNDFKAIETIEMHSRLFIGNTRGEKIELWGGQLKTVQYLHGKESSKNRFFACLGKRKMFVKRLFKAFGASFKKNIFKDYIISDTSCFTYHNQDTLWNLPSKNLRVEKGLRLIGELKKEENSENSIRMEAVFEDGAVEMTVFLPKQNWGKTDVEETRTVSETQSDGTVKPKEIKVTKTITRTEMTLDENNNAESLGPKYVVKYRNTELVKASIEGYIRTIGYSGAGKFEITANPNNPSKEISSLYHFSYTSGEKLFGAYDGTISLTAISDTIDLDKLDFTVNIDILNSVSNAITANVIKKAVDKYTESYKNVFIESLLPKLTNYEGLEKKYAQFVQEFSRSSQSARESVQRSKIKRARSLQSANKRCSHECKSVHMPGLKWDGNCMTTSSGHIAGCMKFLPSKDIVSDVGCLARCESERVRSHVEAITRDAETRNLIAEYQYKAQCEEIASKLHYDIITSELETLKKLREEVAGDAGEFMRSIIETSERNTQFVQLMHLNADVKLNDIEQPSCVNFEVKFSINLHDGAVSTPQYFKSVCFTGNSAEILVEDAFERAFKDKNVELQGKLDDIAASISKLDAEYESKFILSKRETYVTDCLEKKPLIFSAEDEEKFKRSYIPDLELSPLHTSNFHVFSDQTILLFEKYSPWSTLERDDPFHEVEKHSLQKSESQPDNSNTVCAATKRTVDDFQDIVGYMKKWAHAHQNGQESLLNIRTSIAKQLNNTATAISDDALRAMSSIDTENMYHWLSVTEVGIKRWLDLSTQHLEKLNKEGFSLLKARVKTMYQDKGHDNFEAYFTTLAQDGNTAFKKARIETPDGDFSVLAKDLLEIWKKDYTLNEMTPLLGKLEKTVEKAEKRSVSCVD